MGTIKAFCARQSKSAIQSAGVRMVPLKNIRDGSLVKHKGGVYQIQRQETTEHRDGGDTLYIVVLKRINMVTMQYGKEEAGKFWGDGGWTVIGVQKYVMSQLADAQKA